MCSFLLVNKSSIRLTRCIFVFIVCIFNSLLTGAQDENIWRVLPIRSLEEYNNGAFGGEGEQHPHSIARCYQHPEYIYLSHDVGGSWRSKDNGETWSKNLDKGLFLGFGQSIAVDPVDHDVVLIILDEKYNYLAPKYQGVYRSDDGGESWELVLQAETKSVSIDRHNIEFDRTVMNGDEPVKTWYAALTGNGLYRSDDGGKIWSNNPLSSLKNHNTIYQVKTHPTDSRKVFVASDLGLFLSTKKGSDLSQVESLPANVSSIEINPNNPDSIFATVPNNGLFLSLDAGVTFQKIRTHDAVRLHINPGFPEQIYLVGENKNSLVSHNGGASWQRLPEATTFPGLGRETGWRRWIDGDLSGIVPNPQNKKEAVFYSRSTLFKSIDGAASIHESATGWTGNAWTWTDNSAVFDRFDSNKFAFFCNDVGTRITTSGGDWFHANTNSQAGLWYQQNKIKWYGTYAGDFYPEAGSQIMVAGIGNYFKTQLMRTENLGKTWTLVTEGDAMENMNLFVAFNPEDPNIVYAGNKYSTDAGKTFSPFPFPKKYDNPYVIGMCNAYPDVIFALDKGCYVILRSCDQGQHWEEFAKPGWRFRYFDELPTFIADPLNPNKIYTLDKNHDLASYDGKKWTSFKVLDNVDVDISYNYIRNVAIDPNDPDIIYAGMFASGGLMVLRTLDGGKKWEDISYNLSRNGGALKVNPHTGELYRGSHFGTWIFPAPYDEVPFPDSNDNKFGINITPDSVTLPPGATKLLNTEVSLTCLEGLDILWTSSDTAVAKISTSGEITAISEGTCTITAKTGTEKFTADCNVVVDPNSTGTHPIQKTRFKSYIDSRNQLSITFSSAVNLSNIALYNLLGEKVFIRSFKNNSNILRKEIDISGLSQGIYLLSVSTDKGYTSQKIMVNH